MYVFYQLHETSQPSQHITFTWYAIICVGVADYDARVRRVSLEHLACLHPLSEDVCGQAFEKRLREKWHNVRGAVLHDSAEGAGGRNGMYTHMAELGLGVFVDTFNDEEIGPRIIGLNSLSVIVLRCNTTDVYGKYYYICLSIPMSSFLIN